MADNEQVKNPVPTGGQAGENPPENAPKKNASKKGGKRVINRRVKPSRRMSSGTLKPLGRGVETEGSSPLKARRRRRTLVRLSSISWGR